MEVLVNASPPLTAGSLFSGVGGMDIGLEWAGFQHQFFAEIDPYCRAVLEARFPGVPVYEDVKLVDADAGYVDLLCGGFPCQDLSVAGKRAGLAGERSGLFFEFMRIVDALRPRAILIENVEGLYSSGSPKGADFGVVLDSLAERGYLASWRTLDSQHFGIAQRRSRVFILGLAGGDPAAGCAGEVFALTEGCERHPQASDPAWPLSASAVGRSTEGSGGRIVGALSAAAYLKYTDQEFVRQGQLVTGHDIPVGVNPSNTAIAGTLPSNQQGGQRTTDIAGAHVYRKSRRAQSAEDAESWVDDGIANTLNQFDTGDTRTTHVVAALPTVRRLTPMECERLMGWPDGWTDIPWNKKGQAPDSRRYAACGNGVVAPVAFWIGARLAEVLRES